LNPNEKHFKFAFSDLKLSMMEFPNLIDGLLMYESESPFVPTHIWTTGHGLHEQVLTCWWFPVNSL
jgi:hypothetical protein